MLQEEFGIINNKVAILEQQFPYLMLLMGKVCDINLSITFEMH